MKYSVRGNLAAADSSAVVELLNKYQLWRLITEKNVEGQFTFEVWLNTAEDKDSLFNELKPIVDANGELIDWHKCTHDDTVSQPCIIEDTYRRY